MKVAMVTLFPDQPDQISGGVAAVAVYLVRELSRLPGLDLEVVAFGSKLGERTVEWDGVPIHYLPPESLPTVIARVWYEQPRAAARAVARLKPDLVHVQGLAVMTCWCPRPRVLTIHGIPERDALYHTTGWKRHIRSMGFGLGEGLARRFCKNVIVISPYVRQALAKQLRGRLWDIENPVADSFFGLPRRPDPGRVLYCGLLIPRKNVLGLIEAFALTAADRPAAQLRLAGAPQDAAYVQACEERAVALGIRERVHFLGSLKVPDLQQELSQAACLALCSFQETAPVAIEEAMAAGVPIVASRLCGLPYMVEDGVTGKLVNPESTADIAAGIRTVLDADHERMSARSIEQAEHRFRASVVAHRTYEVYQEVLGRK